MPFPLLAAGAATAAAAAYLDAKYFIRHDLWGSSIQPNPGFIERRHNEDRMLVYHTLQWQAETQPDHPFVIFEGRMLTYRQFLDAVHRVGNWLMNDLGIQRQEVVPINGTNSIEYLILWLALDSIAACPAFLNHNLTGAPLVHCVTICDGKYMIAEDRVKDLVSPIEQELQDKGFKTIYYTQEFFASLTDSTPIPQSRRSGLEPTDLRSLIYTSGTTGMPKGTMMLTGRELNTARGVAEYLNIKSTDRMYTCMPLYHGAAHGLLVTPCIHVGATVCLGRKFSHRTFWPEVIASEANIVQYVGELARYLVNAPPSPLDRQHKVTMAWGNGMRPDVWEPFRQRFGITAINELYAATDGLGSSFNYNRGNFSKHAIGKRGLIWHLKSWGGEVRARIDPDTEELMRDARGFAIKCKADEAGEVLHKTDPESLAAVFAGYYKNPDAGKKRLIYDVFEKGDMYFRSGDMHRQNADGLVYFVDRLGDTFRWKSENVSTNEVADIVGDFGQIYEANVYGVAVPRADGRAGAAFLTFVDGVTEATFDWAGLAAHVAARLPAYARPLFVRVGSAIDHTGTMKMQKGRLKKEGVDPDAVASTDRIYWLPPGADLRYVPFTRADWDRLKSGHVKM